MRVRVAHVHIYYALAYAPVNKMESKMDDLKFLINDKEFNIDEAYKLYKELEKVFGTKTMFTYSPPVKTIHTTDWVLPYVTYSGSWV